MPAPNDSPDPMTDPDDSTMNNRTEQDEPNAADQPFCRIFGGPTSHRVQFAGPESRPATAIDRAHNERPLADGPHRDELRAAGGRAIAAILERRLVALERAIEPLQEAYWRGESPEVADVRVVRIRLAELQIAIEEYAARACPDAVPWGSAGEHVPRARLVERLARDASVQRLENRRGDGEECGEP